MLHRRWHAGTPLCRALLYQLSSSLDVLIHSNMLITEHGMRLLGRYCA
jgi:hypothetical protein